MVKQMTRRNLARTALAAAAGATVATALADPAGSEMPAKTLIVGVSCSPRKGKTTAKATQVALEAAQKVDSRIEVRFLDLGGLNISVWSPEAQKDDFEPLLPTLREKSLGGLIIASPVYFRTMSALCKAFIERLGVLQKPDLLLAGVAVGALSVGSYRNGGQELVLEEIHNAMLCHEAVVVGGKAGAFQGATLWNAYQDDITKDELGMESAQKLGIRLAEAALKK